jgi:hypothetical protein
MAVVTESSPREHHDLRDRGWFPVVAAVALVVVLGVVVTRVLRHDVVTDWKVLAVCPAADGAVVRAVSSSLDTSACSATPTAQVTARGWPVVAAVVPASAGAVPDVTRVRVDTKARSIVLEYRRAATPASTPHIVYVEVPPTSLPEPPVTVTAAPTG